jgi:outer membrane translocation and assembly module TamA
LNAVDAPSGVGPQQEASESAAMIIEFHHDLRDNPLNPQRGFKLLFSGEFASEELGGEVEYQRLELASSIHFRLGGGRLLHLGANHGAIVQAFDDSTVLPFNKRFFPGGENSIRGYQRGEAAPRNANGEIVGAETFLLGTVEVGQALTPSWSVVGFVDAITFARTIEDYPGDESLYSVGGGIRWKTVIGPARLEYGYNLNPRAGDPTRTLQFSLGFPF